MVNGFLAGAGAGAAITIVINAVDNATGVLKGINKSMLGVGAAITAAGGAAALALGNVGIQAAKAQPIAKSFANLMGKDSVKALNRLKKATRGTVSDLDLMTQANQALLLGIDPEALPAMFEGALSAAQATGRPISSAIEDITVGIGRQSKLILDNLGILVSAEKANEEYAKALGKTTSELTDAERKIAFTNATMEALLLNQEKIGEITDNTSIKTQRMQASFDNLKITIGNAVIPIMDALVSVISPVLTFFEQHPTIAKWAGIIAVAATALALIVGPLLMLVALLPAISAGFAILSAVTLPITGTMLLIGAAIIALIAIGFLLFKNWKKIWSGILDVTETVINKVLEGINKMINALNKIPGVNIGAVGTVDFSAARARLAEAQVPEIDTRTSNMGQTNVSIENIFGTDPSEISRALSDELNNKVSL